MLQLQLLQTRCVVLTCGVCGLTHMQKKKCGFEFPHKLR